MSENNHNEADALFATRRKKQQDEEAQKAAKLAEEERLAELERQKQQVAEEIKKLAESSKATADDSNKNNDDIRNTVEQLIVKSAKLVEIVEQVNGSADVLTASAEETAVSIDVMEGVADSVESSLKDILKD